MRELVASLAFCGFVGAKLAGGTYLATWSWWWLLMPFVPWLGTAVHFALK